MKQYYTSTNAFEKNYPYYRAVRQGNHIFVSGTTATGSVPRTDGRSFAVPQVLFPGDARKQAEYAMKEGIKAIRGLGGRGTPDVVRVRMFVSSREYIAEVGEAFKTMFGQKKDHELGVAATMLIVQLVNKDMLCEIEMDALLPNPHL